MIANSRGLYKAVCKSDELQSRSDLLCNVCGANGLRRVVVLVTISMTAVPLFVYAALRMILKQHTTGG
jgi:hypothetical protein